MDEPKVSQAALLVLLEELPPPINNSQLALLALSGPPSTPCNITQLALFCLLSNARGYIKLENPIGLDCWQPCTQYGTYSTIIYLGN